MPRKCFVTGKGTRSIKTSTRSGLAKAKGGVGLKRTGVHKRTQKPNLQKKTLWLDGKPQRVWLSTKALRSLAPEVLMAPSRRQGIGNG
jgi:large subunit ribosomal protein L28